MAGDANDTLLDGQVMASTIDADTYDAGGRRFRSHGIDAYENSTPQGQAATARAEELTSEGVIPHALGRGFFNREIAVTELPDETTMEDRLVAEGHAAQRDFTNSGRFTVGNTGAMARFARNQAEINEGRGVEPSAPSLPQAHPTAERLRLDQIARRKWDSGWANARASGYAFGHLLTTTLLPDPSSDPSSDSPLQRTARNLRSQMDKGTIRNMEEAQQWATGYSLRELLDDKNDIGARDWVEWGVGTLAEMTPFLASIMATRGVGSLAGHGAKKVAERQLRRSLARGVRKGIYKSENIDNIVAKQLSESIAANFPKYGARFGALMGSGGLESGGLHTDIRNETGQERPLLALGAGMLAGALDVAGLEAILGKAFGKNGISKEITGNIARRFGEGFAKGGAYGFAVEAPTETLQELILISGEELAKGVDDTLMERIFSEDNRWRLMESAAAGGLMGSVFGGGTTGGAAALFGRRAAPDELSTSDQAPPPGGPEDGAPLDLNIDEVEVGESQGPASFEAQDGNTVRQMAERLNFLQRKGDDTGLSAEEMAEYQQIQRAFNLAQGNAVPTEEVSATDGIDPAQNNFDDLDGTDPNLGSDVPEVGTDIDPAQNNFDDLDGSPTTEVAPVEAEVAPVEAEVAATGQQGSALDRLAGEAQKKYDEAASRVEALDDNPFEVSDTDYNWARYDRDVAELALIRVKKASGQATAAELSKEVQLQAEIEQHEQRVAEGAEYERPEVSEGPSYPSGQMTSGVSSTQPAEQRTQPEAPKEPAKPKEKVRLRQRNMAMGFEMKPEEVRSDLRAKYPKGVTTAQLMNNGERRATTRRQELGKVGDVVQIRGVNGLWRIKKVHKPDFSTQAGIKAWEQLEGWDYEQAKKAHPDQLDGLQYVLEKAEGVEAADPVTKESLVKKAGKAVKQGLRGIPARLISGGQTGADRGGLFAGALLGIETGGSAPRGFFTEEGEAAELASFGLEQTKERGYDRRTLRNAREADATIIFADNTSSPGTILTTKYLGSKRPYIILGTAAGLKGTKAEKEARQRENARAIADFLWNEFPQGSNKTLNIAGHRESTVKGLEQDVQNTLQMAIRMNEARGRVEVPDTDKNEVAAEFKRVMADAFAKKFGVVREDQNIYSVEQVEAKLAEIKGRVGPKRHVLPITIRGYSMIVSVPRNPADNLLALQARKILKRLRVPGYENMSVTTNPGVKKIYTSLREGSDTWGRDSMLGWAVPGPHAVIMLDRTLLSTKYRTDTALFQHVFSHELGHIIKYHLINEVLSKFRGEKSHSKTLNLLREMYKAHGEFVDQVMGDQTMVTTEEEHKRAKKVARFLGHRETFVSTGRVRSKGADALLDKGLQKSKEVEAATDPETKAILEAELDALREQWIVNDIEYLTNQEEWFAEQIAKWLNTNAEPKSALDKFFAQIASMVKTMLRYLGVNIANPGVIDAETGLHQATVNFFDHWLKLTETGAVDNPRGLSLSELRKAERSMVRNTQRSKGRDAILNRLANQTLVNKVDPTFAEESNESKFTDWLKDVPPEFVPVLHELQASGLKRHSGVRWVPHARFKALHKAIQEAVDPDMSYGDMLIMIDSVTDKVRMPFGDWAYMRQEAGLTPDVVTNIETGINGIYTPPEQGGWWQTEFVPIFEMQRTHTRDEEGKRQRTKRGWSPEAVLQGRERSHLKREVIEKYLTDESYTKLDEAQKQEVIRTIQDKARAAIMRIDATVAFNKNKTEFHFPIDEGLFWALVKEQPGQQMLEAFGEIQRMVKEQFNVDLSVRDISNPGANPTPFYLAYTKHPNGDFVRFDQGVNPLQDIIWDGGRQRMVLREVLVNEHVSEAKAVADNKRADMAKAHERVKKADTKANRDKLALETELFQRETLQFVDNEGKRVTLNNYDIQNLGRKLTKRDDLYANLSEKQKVASQFFDGINILLEELNYTLPTVRTDGMDGVDHDQNLEETVFAVRGQKDITIFDVSYERAKSKYRSQVVDFVEDATRKAKERAAAFRNLAWLLSQKASKEKDKDRAATLKAKIDALDALIAKLESDPKSETSAETTTTVVTDSSFKQLWGDWNKVVKNKEYYDQAVDALIGQHLVPIWQNELNSLKETLKDVGGFDETEIATLLQRISSLENIINEYSVYEYAVSNQLHAFVDEDGNRHERQGPVRQPSVKITDIPIAVLEQRAKDLARRISTDKSVTGTDGLAREVEEELMGQETEGEVFRNLTASRIKMPEQDMPDAWYEPSGTRPPVKGETPAKPKRKPGWVVVSRGDAPAPLRKAVEETTRALYAVTGLNKLGVDVKVLHNPGTEQPFVLINGSSVTIHIPHSITNRGELIFAMAHEFGHVVQTMYLTNEQKKNSAVWRRLQSQYDKANTDKTFEEWFADGFGEWVVDHTRNPRPPRNIAEKFFADTWKRIRALWTAVKQVAEKLGVKFASNTKKKAYRFGALNTGIKVTEETAVDNFSKELEQLQKRQESAKTESQKTAIQAEIAALIGSGSEAQQITIREAMLAQTLSELADVSGEIRVIEDRLKKKSVYSEKRRKKMVEQRATLIARQKALQMRRQIEEQPELTANDRIKKLDQIIKLMSARLEKWPDDALTRTRDEFLREANGLRELVQRDALGESADRRAKAPEVDTSQNYELVFPRINQYDGVFMILNGLMTASAKAQGAKGIGFSETSIAKHFYDRIVSGDVYFPPSEQKYYLGGAKGRWWMPEKVTKDKVVGAMQHSGRSLKAILDAAGQRLVKDVDLWYRTQKNAQGESITAFHILADLYADLAGKPRQLGPEGLGRRTKRVERGSKKRGDAHLGHGYVHRVGNKEIFIPEEPFMRAVDRLRGNWNTDAQLQKAFELIDNEDAVLDALYSREETDNAAVNTFRKFMSRFFREYVHPVAKNINDFGPMYFPVMWDAQKLIDNHEKWVSTLMKGDPSRDIEPMTREDAEGFWSSITQAGGMEDWADPATSFAPGNDRGMKRNEELVKRHALLTDFMNRDIQHTVKYYIDNMVRRVEFERANGMMKTGYDKENNRYFRYWDILGKQELLLEMAREQGATGEQLTRAKKILEAYKGRLGADINPTLRNFYSAVQTYTNTVLLPLATLSSFVDIGNAFSRSSGTMPVVDTKKLVAAFRAYKNKDEWYRAAVMHGLVTDRIVDDILAQRFDTSFMTPKYQRINEKFFRLIGMHQWTSIMRIYAMMYAQDFLVKHANGFNKHSKTYLDELGLTADEVKKWESEGRPTWNGNPDAPDHVRKVGIAINRYVSESIFQPDATQRPLYGSDPNFMLVWHLKSFGYSFYKNILTRLYMQAKDRPDVLGKVLAFAPVLAMLPIAVVAMELRNLIQYGLSDDEPFNHTQGFSFYLQDAISRAGMLGPAQFVLDAFEAGERGKFMSFALLGPTLSIFENAMRRDEGTAIMRTLPFSSVRPAEMKDAGKWLNGVLPDFGDDG